MKFLMLSVAMLAMVLAGCQRNPPAQPVAHYQMHGEILSLDPKAQTAMIKHDKIEGWMEAMTMEYPVKDKQEFAKLKVGETIDAKILVQGTDYWISAVSEAAPPAPSGASSPAKANAPK